MAYDPQANRRRPRPTDEDSAPIDALIGSEAATPPTEVAEDPPPSPAVTPAPADPPPDTLLLNTGIAGAAATIIGLLTLRHLWRRRQKRRGSADEPIG